MAKSQKRSSREPKKPKASKKPAAVAESSFTRPPVTGKQGKPPAK
jgi:hypothetical protein